MQLFIYFTIYLIILLINYFYIINTRLFLASQSSSCKYKSNNQLCNGKAKLRRTVKNTGDEYFIGCDKWVKGEKWHRYIKVSEEIDLELLRDLFQGRGVCIFDIN